MGAVEKHINPLVSQLRNNPLNRQHQRTGAANMREQHKLGLGRHRSKDRIHGLVRISMRKINRRDLNNRTGHGAEFIELVHRRHVFMIGDENLIASFEIKIVQNRRNRDRPVGDQCKVFAGCVDKPGQRAAGVIVVELKIEFKEMHRIAFKPAAEFGLRSPDDLRATPIRPVVELDQPLAHREMSGFRDSVGHELKYGFGADGFFTLGGGGKVDHWLASCKYVSW